MIEIDDKIVSTDILTVRFCCDLSRCRGMCCVEGSSGAPLADEEADILEREFDSYKQYMIPEGIRAVEQQGFVVVDTDGDYTTPLIGDADCAFAFRENGVVLCAVEKAYREGKSGFIKPISCHMYPIRVKKFGNGTYGLNYHRWDVCSPALEYGKSSGVPMYRVLKEPIIRCFGPGFYDSLEEAAGFIEQQGE